MDNTPQQNFENIISALKDSDWGMRRPVSQDLKALEHPHLFREVLDWIGDDPLACQLAADQLGKIEYGLAFDVLLDLAHNDNPPLQSLAVYILGQIRASKAIEQIILLFLDKKRNLLLRKAASKALADIGNERAIQTLIQVYLDITETTCGPEDYGARHYALIALSRFGDKTLPLFLSTIKAINPKTRQFAAMGLGMSGSPQAVTPLIQALQDENDHVRDTAANILGRLRELRAFDAMISDLFERKAPHSTCRALGELGDPRACDPLFKFLRNEEGKIEISVCYTLVKFGDKRVFEPLVELLQEQVKRPSIGKAIAADLLGELGDPRAFEPLMEALKDKDDRVRVAAAQSLATFGDERALPALEELLQSEFRLTRIGRDRLHPKEVVAKTIEDLKARIEARKLGVDHV